MLTIHGLQIRRTRVKITDPEPRAELIWIFNPLPICQSERSEESLSKTGFQFLQQCFGPIHRITNPEVKGQDHRS